MTDYAQIGVGYATRRVADPRIEVQLHAALGDAASVLNVGAGTGNYEPRDRDVVAVEPSLTMLAQRAPDAAPAVRGFAESLPFADGSFDVAMGVLTVHHWRDRARGMQEVLRVAGRVAFLYFEPEFTDTAWILDYWPEMLELPSELDPPGEPFFRQHLAVDSIEPVLVPADCTDGFAGAYWRRPEAYLDPDIARGMSSLAQLGAEVYERGARRLRADLDSGVWAAHHGDLLEIEAIDLGYRIVTGQS